MEAKRGRPATGQSPVISVRVPEPLLTAVKAKLVDRSESLTDVVLHALTRYVRDRPADRKEPLP